MIPEDLALYYISYIITGIGLLVNGFIAISNLFWWMKGQTVQTINVLLTSLGLLRIVLLGVHAEIISLSISGSSLFQVGTYPEYLDILATCLMFCNLWWGSVLCVFCCVKITNYSNTLFMRLKMKISKMVPWLLLISLVISVLSSLPSRWVVFSIPVFNSTVYGNRPREVNVVNLFIIIFAGCIVPFTICCVSICLIIVSLLRHTRHMSSRNSGFRDIQREVHLNVIWSMISFLFLIALYFAAYIIFIITIYNLTFSLFCFPFLCAFPSLQSIALIISNKELKNSFVVVLSWLGNMKRQNN